VIASGNHLLTQVKDNQPNLRRRLELGAMGRKPSGSATSQSKGRNRWETRELKVFPAKAWFRHRNCDHGGRTERRAIFSARIHAPAGPCTGALFGEYLMDFAKKSLSH
jgi:hypothetical protein